MKVILSKKDIDTILGMIDRCDDGSMKYESLRFRLEMQAILEEEKQHETD